MKTKLYFLALFLVLVVPSVVALSQAYDTIEVPRGENVTASLPLFSRTWLQVYEGSTVNFNVVDPDNQRAVLIRNSLVIEEIKPTTTIVSLSLDGAPYEQVEILAGEEMQLNYTYEFMPYMLLSYNPFHYSENSEERYITLYFNVPFLKVGKSLDGAPATGLVVLTPDQISAGGKNNKKKGIDPVILILIGVIMLLILAIVYVSTKLKR